MCDEKKCTCGVKKVINYLQEKSQTVVEIAKALEDKNPSEGQVEEYAEFLESLLTAIETDKLITPENTEEESYLNTFCVLVEAAQHTLINAPLRYKSTRNKVVGDLLTIKGILNALTINLESGINQEDTTQEEPEEGVIIGFGEVISILEKDLLGREEEVNEQDIVFSPKDLLEAAMFLYTKSPDGIDIEGAVYDTLEIAALIEREYK